MAFFNFYGGFYNEKNEYEHGWMAANSYIGFNLERYDGDNRYELFYTEGSLFTEAKFPGVIDEKQQRENFYNLCRKNPLIQAKILIKTILDKFQFTDKACEILDKKYSNQEIRLRESAFMLETLRSSVIFYSWTQKFENNEKMIGMFLKCIRMHLFIINQKHKIKVRKISLVEQEKSRVLYHMYCITYYNFMKVTKQYNIPLDRELYYRYQEYYALFSMLEERVLEGALWSTEKSHKYW